MSDATGAGGMPANELQFDHADYAAPQPATTCGACGQPMHDLYYEVNGQTFCQRCREQIHQALTGGSAVGRFLRAGVYGSLAGLLGGAIYGGVILASNVNFGLLAILVGWMVGKAVRQGSNARGGWFYQALAVLLTYNAIVLAHIPLVVKGIAEQARQQNAAVQPGKPGQPGAVQPANPVNAPAAAAPAGGGLANQPPSFSGFLLALLALIGLVYALPVMAGFQSPILLLIAAFGLYQAWALNKRMPLAIRGPYRIGAADLGSGVHVEPAG